MKFTIIKNQVTFNKGCKPGPIKEAQREVCSIYKALCHIQAPRGKDNAYAAYLLTLDPKHWAMLKEVSPYYPAYVASASRAYSAMGDTLMSRPMYHMNVFLSPKDIAHITGLPKELLAALSASGETEFMFMAREA